MTPITTKLLKILIPLVIIYAPLSQAAIECSGDKYAAKINEINLASGQFIEIYFTSSITTSDWDLCYLNSSGSKVCSTNSTRVPANDSYTTGDFAVFTLPSDMDTKDGEILLKDSSGDAIDSLTYCNGSSCTSALWDFDSNCTTTFTNHSPGQTDIFRSPDGSGSFDNNKTTTKGCSNDGCGVGSGDTAATDFNCVENGTNGISGKLYTKTTAQSFSFDIIALQNASTIETSFASGADHTVTVELVDTTSGDSCSAYPALSSFPSHTITFASGDSGTKASSTLSPSSSKAYSAVKCRITDTTASPSDPYCSTDRFAIRPVSFSSVTSNMNNTSSGAGVTAKAGNGLFSITASATVGYNGTPQYNSTLKDHNDKDQTNQLLGSFSSADIATGEATGADFKYNEVGLVKFAVNDIYDDGFTAIDGTTDCTNDFSNIVDADGKIGCKFGNTESLTIGRFTPHHFTLDSSLITPACNSFSYMNQPFIGFSYSISARNSMGNITKNYHGIDYVRMTAIDFVAEQLDIQNHEPTPGYNLNKNAESAPRLSQPYKNNAFLYDKTQWLEGVYAVNNSATNFLRDTTLVDGAFDALNIGIILTEDDNTEDNIINFDTLDMRVSVNADNCLTNTPNNCEEKKLGTTEIRFGRLNIENAYGSELLALSVPFYTEYYNGTSFIKNTDDACTTATVSQLNFNGGSNPITVGSGTSTASIANSP